ncbi:formimidoylglutamate deiminase [Mesorhizobium sp. M1C.F.Ca.ET.193.01.1.1]|uniref:formimidoylglutamate deiminase n=1 Tax=unclassified Mesorhizobium TaxID=325217 RepID=UPI000FD370CC|nr:MULTISPECIES: formimidoylglutamate deiminase [unclassified Mesorhizobium]TGT00247.1 formimidoylglutamate deiminase [bacterium M00.F.Ca.ET.177.01.1.1]TGQ53653.1 formimidoylglutamate deiminase [Mesorhizobium sp. M1C.F.Ca.ET.210.01.1.1]TGQ71685.1 formimidoylglutamate deiminase [Mesorhizobium sp. M1C.F.Ca.ET.212.01.1.1]TGR08426.1 formimidoylglutamate deiminase [Mesorhizobium sp. M1C.F.Ca.ET.204.01.1.1]TGR28667.1 formimidoylglutamate deiminase [Mesorhizobium sp. M1C.F.Ca.ET.196.01.1.1]
MTAIFAEQALLPDGWQGNVRIATDGGRIIAVETSASPQASDERHAILIPGMPNLHSHAFQRGMAGLAELRGPSADSFWSWREVMYRFALSMTPDQVEAVAAQLYVEMLEAGFSRVGEFHYLHHDRDGRPYANIAEMAERIAAATGETGIGLTLLPVFYVHSAFGGAVPNEGQRRFINDVERFGRLLEKSRESVSTLEQAVVGVAPHSLRAATPDELNAIVAMAPDGPIHIHVAEQVKEVEDCVAWSGKRPVELLLDHANVDKRWCLIHATHMADAETVAMARSGAIAGLCPITEANLGDGTFAAPLFIEHGGRFGIGSDSNVLIGLPDELRQLEYSQRLAHRARNVLARAGGSTGRALFDAALDGGSAALGAAPSAIAVGGPADLVSLDASHPSLAGKAGDAILDAWIFANGSKVDCVWVHGKKQVSGGRHAKREAVAKRFRAVMTSLSQG